MYLSTKIYECISRLFILYVHHAPKQNDVILMQYHRKAVGELNLKISWKRYVSQLFTSKYLKNKSFTTFLNSKILPQ
jgi:hypothetical protein